MVRSLPTCFQQTAPSSSLCPSPLEGNPSRARLSGPQWRGLVMHLVLKQGTQGSSVAVSNFRGCQAATGCGKHRGRTNACFSEWSWNLHPGTAAPSTCQPVTAAGGSVSVHRATRQGLSTSKEAPGTERSGDWFSGGKVCGPAGRQELEMEPSEASHSTPHRPRARGHPVRAFIHSLVPSFRVCAGPPALRQVMPRLRGHSGDSGRGRRPREVRRRGAAWPVRSGLPSWLLASSTGVDHGLPGPVAVPCDILPVWCFFTVMWFLV